MFLGAGQPESKYPNTLAFGSPPYLRQPNSGQQHIYGRGMILPSTTPRAGTRVPVYVTPNQILLPDQSPNYRWLSGSFLESSTFADHRDGGPFGTKYFCILLQHRRMLTRDLLRYSEHCYKLLRDNFYVPLDI